MIRFINANNTYPAEVNWQLYGQWVINEWNVRKWCHLSYGKKINIYDEERSGLFTGIRNELKAAAESVDAHIPQNRRQTFYELHKTF